LVGLILLFGIVDAVFRGNQTSILSAAFSVVLSTLLVILYNQQKEVLKRQEKIMETNYLPMLSYDNCEFSPNGRQTTLDDSKDIVYEVPQFDVYNYGQGKSINIRSKIIIGSDLSPSMGRDIILEKMRDMAQKANLNTPAVRVDNSLEKPSTSLDQTEKATFRGKSDIKYLPTGETYENFQMFDPKDVEIGDHITAIIVVEYEDILGNKYRDVPYGIIIQYVPNVGLREFPVSHKSVPHPEFIEMDNIESTRGFLKSEGRAVTTIHAN